MSTATKVVTQSARATGRTASAAAARVRDGLQASGGLKTLPAQARRTKTAFTAGWKAGRTSSRALPGQDAGRPGVTAAAGAVLGLGAGYLLRDRLGSDSTADGERTGERPASGQGGDPSRPNDPTLANTVRTEIFRDADAPKDSVNVSAELGVVYLRGEVDDAAWIERLVSEARKVEGVQGVENLLHLPGEPAPTKAA